MEKRMFVQVLVLIIIVLGAACGGYLLGVNRPQNVFYNGGEVITHQ